MNSVQLGDLCRPRQWPVVSGRDMSSGGFPVFGANGQIGWFNTYTHSEETIAVGCRGSCGEVHLVPPKSYINGNAMALDELDERRVERRYLLRWLQFRGFRDITTGTSQPQIIQSNIRRVEVPLPPLPAQKRIAAILDKADGIRAKRRAALAEADALLRAIFLDMFGDPVANPKGWTVVPLGELGILERGRSTHRPRNDPRLLGGPYPLIQTGDVARANDVITGFTATYSELGLEQSRLWPAGTLCITIAANIAETAVIGFDACFPDSVVGFVPGDRVNSEYVQNSFQFVREHLAEKAPTVAQANINLRILRDLELPVPPLGIQAHFAAIVGQQRLLRRRSESALAEADALYASLAQGAFRGEL